MLRRLLPLCSLVTGVALVAVAQQPAARRARMHDVPTPGVLAGLRTASAPRPSVDASGITADIPPVWDVDPTTGAEYRRGQILVQFDEGAAASQRVVALNASGGARVIRTLPSQWNLVALDAGVSPPDAMRKIRTAPGVRDASLNYRVTTQQFRPNDEFYSLQWNFDAISLPVAWQINPGARSDVVVAVVDTGLNTLTDTFVVSSPVGEIPVRFAEVPDLVTAGRIVAPYDFVYDDPYPVDLGGHGTHVAGTIGQQTNNSLGVAGIAYNVNLMPLKAISDDWDDIFVPGNLGGTVVVLSEAIRYAADNGAKVINLSLGGFGPMPTVRDAISYAVSRGAFVSIAAGNEAEEGNPANYPASYASQIDGAMAVGAVTRSLKHARYSSFHPYVEICAPGGELTSVYDYEGGITQVSYEEASSLSFFAPNEKFAALLLGFRPAFDRFELRPFQGTSMATPHVSGVAALLYSQGIHDPAAIEEAIERFAQPIEATADECGAGLVDARRALRGLGLAR